jgi:hypothetical protein
MARVTRWNGDFDHLAAWGNAPDVVAATASYAPVLGDAGSTIIITAAGATTFTIAPQSSVAWPVGAEFTVVQGGAGAITMTPGAGVTIAKLSTKTLATGAANSVVKIRRIAADSWIATGDLA